MPGFIRTSSTVWAKRPRTIPIMSAPCAVIPLKERPREHGPVCGAKGQVFKKVD